jgi:hypothetical protein
MIKYRLKSSAEKSIRRRTPVYREQALQIQCVSWFDRQYPKLQKYLMHIPNGGSRAHKINKYGRQYSPEAQRFKLMGVRAGVSDLLLAYPNVDSHGLWIEIKSEGGKLTENQKEFLNAMGAINYKYAICDKFESFVETISNYLERAK